jgi:flagellar M-ring protein FliF
MKIVRVAAENRLKNVIESLLTRSVGAGKVKAQVALEMNFDRVVTNSEVYDPDGAVVRSTQSLDERDQTPVSNSGGTDASVANNIPGGGDGGDGSLKFAISEKSDQTTNYEIYKIIKNHISESGVVTKMSIGILVDGHYKTNQETGESGVY